MYQQRADRYRRVQFGGESSPTSVQCFKNAAFVLRIIEKEAVYRTDCRLTTTQRVRFVFQALLSSFLQLERLAMVG